MPCPIAGCPATFARHRCVIAEQRRSIADRDVRQAFRTDCAAAKQPTKSNQLNVGRIEAVGRHEAGGLAAQLGLGQRLRSARRRKRPVLGREKLGGYILRLRAAQDQHRPAIVHDEREQHGHNEWQRNERPFESNAAIM